MKSASNPLLNTIKQSHAVLAQPILIAEWNQNRYAGIQEVDNTPKEETDGYDVDLFPISTIAEALRPDRGGIVKSLVGSAVVADGFDTSPAAARYYTVDKRDKYKYWSSPVYTTTNVGPGQYGFAKTVQPYVLYKTLAWVNKIQIVVENSNSIPNNYSIQYTVNGTTWVTAATNVSVVNGKITIYRQANGSWSGGVYRGNPIKIKGVRLVVTAMNKMNAFLHLIEISGRYEVDLTSDLISTGDNYSISETSWVLPLGKASSNTGSVSLSNLDRKYNNENSGSQFYGLIDRNVKMQLFMVFDTTEYGGTTDIVQMFHMYADSWSGQEEDEVRVELKDYSKYLQEAKPVPSFWQNQTIGSIIWSLCDSVGFSNYVFTSNATSDIMVIPYFWTDGTETIWEIFSRLAEITQTAVYFDAFGQLQIKTRDAVYNQATSPVWQLDAVPSTKLADVVEWSESDTYEANKVSVKYRTTKVSEDKNGVHVMETVWEPEDTLTLRSSQLTEALTTSSTYIKIDPDDAPVWLYEGLVQIDGEFIRYKGKGYYYWNKNGTKVMKYVESLEEKNKIDKEESHDLYKVKNTFSGHLKIDKRGEWNTVNVAHPVDASGWFNRHVGEGGAYNAITWNGGFTHTPKDSTIQLSSTTSRFDAHNWYLSTRNYAFDDYANRFGTRLRFANGGYTQGIAGLVFWNNNTTGDAESGYYVELIRTSALGATGRNFHHELNFYKMSAGGVLKRFGPDGGKGRPIAIDHSVWYDIDVVIQQTGSSHLISIAVNGVNQMTVTVSGSDRLSATGRNGLFTRGNTRVAFEYFYAVRGVEDDSRSVDSGSFLDKVRGGWVSGQWEREWTYDWADAKRIVKGKSIKYQQRANNRFFDDFGPYVHEVREFDVKFDKAPVIHSQLYFSNERVFCPEYIGDAFGARFILANASRVNQVVSGDDTTTFGFDNSVQQKCLIYGRLVYQEDEKSVDVEDDDSIRARGPIELEISGEIIQTETAAKGLSEWVVKNWAEGSEEVQVEVFGNPLFELGDKVSGNYPRRDVLPSTHHYVITAISNSFEQGISTSITMRRIKLT